MTIFNNALKTVVLLGLLMGLCIAVGGIVGHERGLILGFVFGGLGVMISYFFSAQIAIASVGAREVQRENAPELYEIVERLAQRASIPMPRIYIAPQEAPNAFATGRGPSNGVVCVTEGLMKMMDGRELEGVIAHELSHIKHRDVLISSVAAVIAGAIAVIARMAFWFGMSGDRRERDNPLGAVGAILMLILAPIAAVLIQLAISRSREFAADARGAQLAGGPEGLISALRKLETMNRQIPMNVSPAENHMFIVMPLNSEKSGVLDLFRTHPSTEKRIARLLADNMPTQNPYANA